MPEIFDIHTHINFPEFEKDQEEVIKRALDNNVWMINIGSNFNDSKKAVEIAEKYNKGVYAAVGLYPLEKEQFNKDEFKKLVINKKVVAIGECGIDLKSSDSDLETQKKLFEQQIELALEVDKPLMIHCREAYDEAIKIISKYPKLRGNFHFFSGTWEQAQKIFELGFTISFGGVITFTNQYNEIIIKTPIDKIMLETDSPFVTPVPFRGKRNEPLYVKEVSKKISEIKNIDYKEVAKITTANALRFFNIVN
jgi:TatD DNase family protein